MRRIAIALAVVITFGTLSSSPRLAANGAQQPANAQAPSAISPEALAQIDSLAQEKRSRTPAQRKMSSQLVYAVKMARGEAITSGVARLDVSLATVGTDVNRVTVDVHADLTDALMRQLLAMNVEVVSASPAYHSLRLQANLDQLETIAAFPQVRHIQQKQELITSQYGGAVARAPLGTDARPGVPPVRKPLDRAKLAAAVQRAISQASHATNTATGTGQGSRESEGDTTHRAFSARGTFNVDGTGVTIGVLSDGVTNLAASQAAGDLGTVTVLPGQTGTGDEGTAMLEIIHDLAPGAALYFATANPTIAQFAQNIRDLRTAGCDIIVDDVSYNVETPFQDGQTVASPTNGGIVIQAVKDVTAAGALYFSSAANSGNLDAGTSGTWEGDFLSGGPAGGVLAGAGLVHDFGAQLYDVQTAVGLSISLSWSDPLGTSANDYDIYRLDSAGTTILAASTDTQDGIGGDDDPFEIMTAGATGNRIVIALFAGSGRFLHLSTNRGVLSIATAGETHGHAAVNAAASFGVAATPALAPFGASPAGPFPNPFNSANVVEVFSSDGPRRIFFNGDGTPITPGNFSSTGGLLLAKPDITAADGTSVTGVGGFASPFYGTSAAAPHAAAIAALIKSSNLSLTSAQIRTALISSAIDIQGAGVDRNSGAGIVMAFGALQSSGAIGTAFLAQDGIAATDNPGNSNGAIEAGEGGKIFITLDNLGVNAATAVSATLTSSTTGITMTMPNTRPYVDMPALTGTATNASAFFFTVASNVACPLVASFTLTVSYTGGGSPAVMPFTVPIGPPPFSITTTLDGTPPASAPGIAATTTVQTGRLTRSGVTSQCSPPKANPGLFSAVGSRQSDAYTFNTCSNSVASCASVTVTQPGTLFLFSAAYAPTYDPANPATNYAGDPGASAASMTYGFPVAGGAGTYAVAVHEVNPAGGVGTAYTLTVSGACGGACAVPNGVPVAIAHDVVVITPDGNPVAASINNGSFDPNADSLTITQSPPGPYALGTTNVLLTVTDPSGATSQASANVIVVRGGHAMADFDGDGKTDPTVFRPSTAGWYNLKSSTNYTSSSAHIWGASTDSVVPGDYDGDGKADPAVFRPSTAGWYVLQSSTNYTTSTGVIWGASTDVPEVGDYDGDGKADPAVFRPSTGGWYFLKSSTGYTSSGAVIWGASTDLTVPGDYDGDGKTDPAVFRPSTGGWYFLKSSTNFTSSGAAIWGASTDIPVPGDYDGDGKTDPAVFRPSSGGWYFLKSSTNFTSSGAQIWGVSTDTPVPGDYDGDGKTDPAVFRPSTGGWYGLKSSTNYTSSYAVVWGVSTDIP